MSDADTASDKASSRKCCSCQCLGRVYRHIAEQRVHGRINTVDLRFSVAVLAVMSIGMIVGGAIMLAMALSQKELYVTYSDSGPLEGLSDEQRSEVMRGASA